MRKGATNEGLKRVVELEEGWKKLEEEVRTRSMEGQDVMRRFDVMRDGDEIGGKDGGEGEQYAEDSGEKEQGDDEGTMVREEK